MKRKETTRLLTDILVNTRLKDRKYFAKEVTLDYGTKHLKRIDVMQFIPKGVVHSSDIEKGIFICYEIKSCIEDIYSGNGLNFYGETNYLVVTMDTYKKLQPDLLNGTFTKFVKEHNPESSNNVGVLVAVPKKINLNSTESLYQEYESPTLLTDKTQEWKLWTAIPSLETSRKRPIVELLFCMLRSKHSFTNMD